MDYLLKSKSLKYRSLALADESFYLHLYTDLQLTQFIGGPLTYKKARRAFQLALKKSQSQKPDYLVLCVDQAPDHYNSTLVQTFNIKKNAIGIIGLTQIDYLNQTAELGIILDSPYQGMKLSHQIYQDALQLSSQALKLNKLYSTMSIQNTAMQKLAIRAGFNREPENLDTGLMTYSITL